MRALLVVLAGVAMLVGVAAQPASAGKTDIEQLIKRVSKYAVENDYTQKPRGLLLEQSYRSMGNRRSLIKFGDGKGPTPSRNVIKPAVAG